MMMMRRTLDDKISSRRSVDIYLRPVTKRNLINQREIVAPAAR